MKNTRYLLVQTLIEADVDDFELFNESEVTSRFNSALKIGSWGRVENLNVFILNSKPGSPSDDELEEFAYRGYRIVIYQEGQTIGSEKPVYFAAAFNMQAKYPSYLNVGYHCDSIGEI